MASNVNNTVKTANYHLKNVGRVRQLLTIETAKQVIQSLVISRLDYCNSLLAGTPTSLIEKLQHVQNKAARIITKTRKHDHITPVLKDLHWLPVRCRINFKILLLVFKALRGKAPVYITNLLTPYQPSRSLRSGDKGLLVQPRARRHTYGDRAFSVYAPRLWNALPPNIRFSSSVACFKKNLKTYFFRQCYE